MNGLVDRVEVRTGPDGTVVELSKELADMDEPSAAPTGLQLRREPDGALTAIGCIDRSTAAALREALEAEALPGQVLDLRGTDYLDSSGLRVIYDHAHRLRLIITDGTAVATVARISGLDEVATVEYTPSP
jgi:anti-anti-sigma factor